MCKFSTEDALEKKPQFCLRERAIYGGLRGYTTLHLICFYTGSLDRVKAAVTGRVFGSTAVGPRGFVGYKVSADQVTVLCKRRGKVLFSGGWSFWND